MNRFSELSNRAENLIENLEKFSSNIAVNFMVQRIRTSRVEASKNILNHFYMDLFENAIADGEELFRKMSK